MPIEYPVDTTDIIYYDGATGDPDHIEGTFPSFGAVDHYWSWGGIADESIIRGFKVVFEASAGVGDMYWNFSIDNPGWPGSPEWTADSASHIGLNNSFDPPASAIHVDGPTTYEHVFVVGDPTFGGFFFNNPLSDLLISLDRAPGWWVNGTLEAAAGVTVPIEVTRWELVLFGGPQVVPARRLHPRTDSHGLGIGRIHPPPNTPQASGRTGSSSPY